MISFLGADATNSSLVEFFQSVIGSLSIDTILFIFAGVMAVVIVASILRLIWCYETRAMRQMKKINKYLKDNPKITESNLVEFHKRMRRLPRRFRDRWQLFMLEREGSPSRYLTVEYCVKRPLYNSAFTTVKKQVAYSTLIVCVLSLIASVAYVSVASSDKLLNVTYLFEIMLVPLVCGLFGCIFCMILHLRFTAINNALYDTFTSFIRNIDKSTNAMPDYVDYELLFTPKEINAGIPVLREYLEKRALEEQRLLEKAKQEEANHSPYNFADLGVNGSQLIERAVTESEKFMLTKIQIQQEITDLEKQLQKTEANMEDIEREANRKLQAIKENLERLDKTMAETTNRVEINYNRRQATEEMNKKAKLEKDLENMLGKEQVAIDALKVEIQKRKEIIEENKEQVETSLKSEYDTFATKVYQELSDKVTRDNSEQMRDLEMVIARLKAKVQEYNKDIEKRDNLVEARNIEVENLRRELRKAKNIIKAGSKKGGKGKVEDVDTIIKEPEHLELKDMEAKPADASVVEEFEVVSKEPEPVKTDEFFEEVAADDFVEEQFEEEPVQEFVGDMPQDFVEVDMNQYSDPMYQEQQFEQMPQQEFVSEQYQPAQEEFVQAPVVEQFVEPQPVEEFEEEIEEEEPVKSRAAHVKRGVAKVGRPGRKIGIKSKKDDDSDDEDEAAKVKEAEEKAKAEEEAKKKAEQEEKEAEEKRLEEERKAEEARKLEEERKQAELEREKERQEQEEARKKADEEMKKKMDELSEELQKNKQELQEMKENKRTEEKDELAALQEQINAENERLKKQQEELRAQIDETLKTMEKATNATKQERTQNIKKIKDLISKLKEEAAEAKERGASKTEINKINKSAAELLRVIADYQANKPIKAKDYE